MANFSSNYGRLEGDEPRYLLKGPRTLIVERDYAFSLYAVDVVVSNGMSGRHVLAVPGAISAVSVTVGVMLTEEDSRKADAGDIDAIASLANAVQGRFRPFRTFPANELCRFVLTKSVVTVGDHSVRDWMSICRAMHPSYSRFCDVHDIVALI